MTGYLKHKGGGLLLDDLHVGPGNRHDLATVKLDADHPDRALGLKPLKFHRQAVNHADSPELGLSDDPDGRTGNHSL